VYFVVSDLLAGYSRVLNALIRNSGDSNSFHDTRLFIKLELTCVGGACRPTTALMMHISTPKAPTQTVSGERSYKYIKTSTMKQNSGKQLLAEPVSLARQTNSKAKVEM
jgi:hypothetical protein